MPLFVTTASRAALSKVSAVEDFDFHKAIEQLVGMSLLEASEALDLSQQRYQMHPLTQAFARKKLGVNISLNLNHEQGDVSSEKILELKHNFCAYFAGWSQEKAGRNFWGFLSGDEKKHREVYLELPNLLLSLDWTYGDEVWSEVLTLAKAIVHPIYYTGQLDKRLKCSQYGLMAAQTLGATEDEMWFTIHGLGSIYLLRGDYQNADKYLKQGIELAQTHSFPDGVALGQTYLGYMALQRGDLLEAQEQVDMALSNAESSLFKYRAHHAAGHIARHRQDFEQAKNYYLKSAEFMAGTGYLDSSDVWLGFTTLGLKKYEKARDYFDKYLETYGEYGNRRVVAMAKLGLARYYEVQGFPAEASDFANQAYELLSQMNAQWELKQVKELLARLEEIDGG
jgi:tetratricopeptide (TPR) repeat protein